VAMYEQDNSLVSSAKFRVQEHYLHPLPHMSSCYGTDLSIGTAYLSLIKQ
jgi:hypothetical protein